MVEVDGAARTTAKVEPNRIRKLSADGIATPQPQRRRTLPTLIAAGAIGLFLLSGASAPKGCGPEPSGDQKPSVQPSDEPSGKGYFGEAPCYKDGQLIPDCIPPSPPAQ